MEIINEIITNLCKEVESSIKVRDYLKKKREKQFEIRQHKIKISSLKNQIAIINEKLFHTCNHNWVIDSAASYMHTKRYCDKCYLDNMPHVYS